MLIHGFVTAEGKARCEITLWILVSAICLARCGVVVEKPEKHAELIKPRICVGTNGRMSVPQNREHHYRNLRDRYTNCTYVDGNLELTWLQDEHLDLGFLRYIREVTGYVLISHVDVSKIVLPRLQIIRGRTLFKLNIQDEEFALLVTLSKMNSLEIPGLRDILHGSVGFFNNYNLCHIKTINWEEILTGVNAKNIYVYNFTSPERECPPCHFTCAAGCWGEGADNCQKFSKINCSPQCDQGRCFGPKPRDCCHMSCAGGCTGPKPTDCLACRDVYDDGVCIHECPPMQRYNQITYSWEPNPNGKYAYGATCVKSCPNHLLKDNGACVKSCPPNKRALNGECVDCEGPCPKACKGVQVVHDINIASFKDCTVIEGSISILDQTFKGFQQINENYSIGPKIPPMHPDKLEVFSTLKEITGYLNIQGYHEKFTNLSYFRNLEVIGGRELTQSYFASLYIVKTSLKFLGLTSLKKIHSGGVAILENKHLCYTEGIDWKKIKKSVEHSTMLQNNKKFDECQRDNETCDIECSSDGCWGPGPNRCIMCAHFQYGDRCLPSCDVVPGLYKANTKQCMPCHEECESMCSGPGPEHCKLCKHVRDGNTCAPFCPSNKYNDSGECRFCHPNCIKGCRGPGNNIGPNGCVSCEKAIINGDSVERCLMQNESCPVGFYEVWQGPAVEQRALKPLAGKAICRRCHPQCRKCTNYGLHESVCSECMNYKRGGACEEECPLDHYADNVSHECLPCHGECKGCYGPDSTSCFKCRNFKIYMEGNNTITNTTAFNCTVSCPPEFPHKVYSDIEEPHCSQDVVGSMLSTWAEPGNPVFIAVMFCALMLGVAVVICLMLWKGNKAANENALKMTMALTSGLGDTEELQPTNVKPNMGKLRTVKETEIRKGGILGSGAFGVVYKGLWFLSSEERTAVRIPVAIKVLREGSGVSTSKEFLDEAYIMASVDHPNLLKLLAVCMTSEMMLITQLMPLGCLLDYVRKNKTQIGSKVMLDWCTQIARGMSYLEERKMIHRDLAARNVLLQTHNCIKITDFGLAKFLDVNEEAYTAAGGKMPIKWLALECIENKIFTHKSDVWAFGVTVWEVLTYGERPYGNDSAEEVSKFLKDGGRLQRPVICSTEVHKLMLSCWLARPDDRPSFKELAEEFAKMARDPGRYLVIPGDRFMKSLSFSPQDEKEEIIRSIAVETEDTLVDSEDYLQPNAPIPSCSNIGIPISDSPLPMSRHNWDREMLRFTLDHHYPGRLCSFKDSDTSDELSGGSSSKREAQVGNLKLDLPLDDDDYLMPSPQLGQSVTTTATSAAYMDLISDLKQSVSDENQNRMAFPKNFNSEFVPLHACIDNPEYHLVSNDQKLGIPQMHQLQHRSSEEESDHEYYNDFDRLRRELQPLRTNRNETTV